MTSGPTLVRGRRVGVWRFGAAGGWPLLWCHGGLSSGRDGALLDAAARRHGADVIAVDRPGIADSEPWPLSSVAGWPDAVERVLDGLGVGGYAVAGWSAGGPYALACAAARPLRVRAAATLAGMAPLRGVREAFELGLWADRLLIPAARVSARLARPPLWLSRWTPERYLAWEIRRSAGERDRAALDDRALSQLLAALRGATAGGVRGTAEDYRRFGGPWGFDPGAVRGPVTVWQGEQDTLVPMEHAVRLAGALPGADLRVVPGCGHYLPAVIADAVLQDLAP
ncbi:alpha/beta fold hydrolase [Mycolicibacterium palauense]|uniref:alpha/beta fold hydrolase n=1 Tax=Mycolicibacterium palauense TaxID=2034511 RepID=UPI000BFEC674|nr:alpha/beta fold hydrolase [Mycolicibacterium palauense]